MYHRCRVVSVCVCDVCDVCERTAQVAEVTAGWSAAALANLMNEAAILTVRDV